MKKRVRHIWAKANQHIKVHRQRRPPMEVDTDDDPLLVIMGIIVLILIIM